MFLVHVHVMVSIQITVNLLRLGPFEQLVPFDSAQHYFVRFLGAETVLMNATMFHVIARCKTVLAQHKRCFMRFIDAKRCSLNMTLLMRFLGMKLR